LFNYLGRLTAPIDQNQSICSHLDMIIISYGAPPSDPVFWNTWAAAIYLNSFKGPVDANVTANYTLQSPKSKTGART
jgi:hypothetical protein